MAHPASKASAKRYSGMSELHNYRQVALKLYALHSGDRTWLLNQLGAQQQSVLRPLIEELSELGVIHTEHLPAQAITCPVSNFDLPSASVKKLNSAPIEVIQKNFVSLPDRLKAMILHCYPWQWAALVWNMLDTHEQTRVLRHVTQLQNVKPAVFAALVDTFTQELSTSRAGTPQFETWKA